MKKISQITKPNISRMFVICTLVVFTFNLDAQVFNYPKVKASTTENVRIKQIEITENSTIVTLLINFQKSNSVYISSKTFICASGGGKPLYVESAEGLTLDKMYYDVKPKSTGYRLFFPKVDLDVNEIDFRSGEKGSYWHFFEVSIATEIGKTGILSGDKGRDGNCRYINNPGYTAKTHGFDISRIEVCDTATILHFKVIIPGGGWVSIPPKSCIRDSEGGKDLFVKYAEGTNIGKRITAEQGNPATIYYKLFFPPIKKSVKKIDFREVNKGGTWSVYELDVSVD